MRPMLAATLTGGLETLRYPLFASIKLDGIRAVVIDGVVLSRTMKPIPNRAVQEMFKIHEGYDGELIMGDPATPDCYRKTVSCCMSQVSDTTGLKFHVFDHFTAAGGFGDRFTRIWDSVRHNHVLIGDAEMLAMMEETVVECGHEGIITRSVDGAYKNGRSTLNEQGMVKIKRFMDDEATVVALEEQMHNANPATTNSQGYTERTSHKANLTPMGVLGALVVVWRGKQFRIGTGFTAMERGSIWKEHYNNGDVVGRIAKFKYLPIGMKDVPRHPVFLGWRME